MGGYRGACSVSATCFPLQQHLTYGVCTDADENSDSSLILKKKKKSSRPCVALALLPECPSVLQNVCVVTCLHLILSAPWSYSSAGSLQPSNLCLLFPLLFPLLPHCPSLRFLLHILSPLCNVRTFPLTPFLAPLSPTSHPSHTWSMLYLYHPPLSLAPWKENLPTRGKGK